MKKYGFTLAEMLISMAIIGVIAAVTVPTLIENLTERINSNRHANIAYKVTQAMEKMRGLGLLSQNYETTENFVDELQKHLRISKRCDSEHIASCWPTEKVTDSNGEEFEVSKAKKGKNLNLATNTNNVGLVLPDGAAIILNYNPAIQGPDVGDPVSSTFKDLPVGFGKSHNFAYTTSATVPIDFVMDVNGPKGPNREKFEEKEYDIRSFRGASFSKGCTGTEIQGVGCVVYAGSYNWHTAVSTCQGLGGHLVNSSELRNINASGKRPPADYPSSYCWLSDSFGSDYVKKYCSCYVGAKSCTPANDQASNSNLAYCIID